MRHFLERLEQVFRNYFTYPFLRLFLRNKPFEGTIDLDSIRSVLILRYDKIGDMIVTKPILRALKRRHPNLIIGVVTSPVNAEIIANDDWVDHRYVLKSNPVYLAKELLRARKEKYDVVLNFVFNRTTSGALLANFVSPHGIKIGQGNQKYAFYFNKLISLPPSDRHMVEMLSFYVSKVFLVTFTDDELKLFYSVDTTSFQRVNEFLEKHMLNRHHHGLKANRYIIVNISVRDATNALSDEQIFALIAFLSRIPQFTTIIIYAPEDAVKAIRVREGAGMRHCLIYPEQGTAALAEIASLLEGAFCAVTPDTAVVHLASAMRTPVLGFFCSARAPLWRPYGVDHQMVIAESEQLVSSIPSTKMIEGVKSFLSTLQDKEKASG